MPGGVETRSRPDRFVAAPDHSGPASVVVAGPTLRVRLVVGLPVEASLISGPSPCLPETPTARPSPGRAVGDCAGGNRTSYLQVMSLASYRCSTAQVHRSRMGRGRLPHHRGGSHACGGVVAQSPWDLGQGVAEAIVPGGDAPGGIVGPPGASPLPRYRERRHGGGNAIGADGAIWAGGAIVA